MAAKRVQRRKKGAAARKPRSPRSPRSTSRKARSTSRKAALAPAGGGSLTVREIEDLREELARLKAAGTPSRWNSNPDDVRRSVAKLVLTLVEFIRRVLERQAIRRHEQGTLTEAESEAIGTALMRLEETIAEMAGTFGLDPSELNLELGPLGRLY